MPQTARESERQLDSVYQKRLDQEIARLREQSKKAVEEFKSSFPPPSDEQIEKLLYPELAEFAVELGGRRFVLCELPALIEKKLLALVERKLPSLVAEILAFDERLDDNAAQAFTKLLARAGTALDLVAETCVLVLDPRGEAGLTGEFIQQHASTARQLRILKAQLLLNGGRDFLSRLFPGWTEDPQASSVIPISPPLSAGSSSAGHPPAKSDADSQSDSLQSLPGSLR